MEESPAFSVRLGVQAACPGVGVAVGGAAAEGFAQSSVFVVGVLADDGVSSFSVLCAAVDGAAVYVGVDVFGAAVSVRMGAQAALSVVAVGFAAAVGAVQAQSPVFIRWRPLPTGAYRSFPVLTQRNIQVSAFNTLSAVSGTQAGSFPIGYGRVLFVPFSLLHGWTVG